MQTQANLENKKLTKQEYNKLYYAKNKSKWEKKKPFPLKANVLNFFAPQNENHDKPKRTICCNQIFQKAELFILIALTIAITAFLIKEATAFYLEAHEGSASAYFKAALVEGVAILFSFSRGRSAFIKQAQHIVALSLCGLTLFIMSEKYIKTALGDTARVTTMQQELHQLEAELSQKEHLREHLLKNRWLGTARRYERGMDLLRQQIHQTSEELSSLTSPVAIWNSLAILIAFRLLLVITNLICVHRIVEHFAEQKEKDTTSYNTGNVLNFLN